MKQIWIIAKKELKSFFNSLIAYILLIVFLGMSGFFTWIYGSDIFFVGQATLQPFFGVAYWTLFFFIPALTMRMVAEEKGSGTIELLLTKPVSDWQFVTGKFLASLLLIIIALAMTIPYYITVALLGPVDHGAVICGYFGMILFSMTLVGIGIFASSVTNNQIVSFLLSLFIGVFFMIIFNVLASNSTGFVGQILNYLSLSTHYDSMARGVIDTRDLIYFGSLTYLSLMFASSILSKRNVVED